MGGESRGAERGDPGTDGSEPLRIVLVEKTLPAYSIGDDGREVGVAAPEDRPSTASLFELLARNGGVGGALGSTNAELSSSSQSSEGAGDEMTASLVYESFRFGNISGFMDFVNGDILGSKVAEEDIVVGVDEGEEAAEDSLALGVEQVENWEDREVFVL